VLLSVAATLLSGAALVLHRAGARLQDEAAFHCTLRLGHPSYYRKRSVRRQHGPTQNIFTKHFAEPTSAHTSINIITYEVSLQHSDELKCRRMHECSRAKVVILASGSSDNDRAVNQSALAECCPRGRLHGGLNSGEEPFLLRCLRRVLLSQLFSTSCLFRPAACAWRPESTM